MNNNNPVKIAILGVGKMGQNHIRNLALLKQVTIAFIYDTNTELAEKIAEQYSTQASKDIENDIKKVDAVIICTPTHTHKSYLVLASKYLKHIFVEKPLTEDLKSSQEMVKMAKDLGLFIQIGFIERYNPAISVLKQLVEGNKKVINMDFMRTNKLSSRITDVDVIVDLMIHDIDLAVSLSGKPKKIVAFGHIKNGLIEFARAVLIHESGTFSNILASRITEKRSRQISVTAESMFIDCNLLTKEVFVIKQTTEQYLEKVSISSKTETIDVRPQEPLLLELIDFIKICQGKKIKVPNEQDGLVAIEIAEEIRNQIMKKSK